MEPEPKVVRGGELALLMMDCARGEAGPAGRWFQELDCACVELGWFLPPKAGALQMTLEH